MNKYDITIIGAGPGGYVAALYAASCGKKVLIIEKDLVGGVCLNWGCIPTKALITSVKALNYIKDSKEFGLDVSSYKMDYSKIKRRKDEVVNRLRNGVESLFKAKGIELKRGLGKLINKNIVEVNGEKIESNYIIIATGSSPVELSNFKFDKKKILSSADVLQLETLPASMLIIGGGANGCEYAYIFGSLGVKVTLVEMMDRLLPTMDRELGKNMEVILKRNGVRVMTNTKFDEPPKGYGKTVVCVGRRGNTRGIGLEDIGIKTERGRIIVDKSLKTNWPCVYAIGDVVGEPLLAHVASHEGIVVLNNIMGRKTEMDYRSVPSCVYTDPEIASVGLTQQEAQERGLNVKVAKFPFRALGKAHVINETDGFVKIIGDEKNDEVIGIQIVGPQAADLIAEATLMVKNRMKVSQIKDLMHAHPTLSEAVMEAAYLFEKTPIHAL